MIPRALRRSSTIAAAALAATLLLGCAPTTDAVPTSAPTAAAPTPEVELPEPTPEATPEPVFAPLTGVRVDAAVTGPALSAKIDNHVDARPQWGLEHADIVFEELVEGGMTRYVAVWHSDVPAEIGPVRSIRPMDPDIVSPLGGVIAYSGGQERFVAMMQDTPVHNAIHGGFDDGFMYRSGDKIAPHNVVVEAQRLRAEYADLAAPAAQFAYAPRGWAPVFGRASGGVDIVFAAGSQRSWAWDAASAGYLRSQNGTADVAASGARLNAVNVVTLSVPIDWSYGIIPRTVMVGSGAATVSTGGNALEVTWSKASRDAPIVLTGAAGGTVRLAPGNTWVELVPDDGSVSLAP